MSYSRTKDVLLSRLREVTESGINLGLHSLRSGGASNYCVMLLVYHMIVRN